MGFIDAPHCSNFQRQKDQVLKKSQQKCWDFEFIELENTI